MTRVYDDGQDDGHEASSEALTIPACELSAAALHGVIESFVLREGTDYGEHEIALEQKVAQVRQQLERGEASIVFDPASGSIDIVVDRSRPASTKITGV